MGYYTYFEIAIAAGDESLLDSEKFAEYFDEVTGYNWPLTEDIKWLNFEADIKHISGSYPDILFEIWGDGEDYEDKWHAYACNGELEVVYAEYTYPEIDYKKVGDIEIRHPELFI